MGKKHQPPPPEIMRKGGAHGKSEKAKRKAEEDALKDKIKRGDWEN